jgi:hypothetical protein
MSTERHPTFSFHYRVSKVSGWPTLREFNVQSFFRVTVESTRDIETLFPFSRGSYDNWVVFGRFLRFGLTVKTPFTGTVRKFGIDRPC